MRPVTNNDLRRDFSGGELGQREMVLWIMQAIALGN